MQGFGKSLGKGLAQGSGKGFCRVLAKVFNRCVMNFSHNDIYSGFMNFSTFCCVFCSYFLNRS